MSNQQAALIKLLGDDDPETVALVKAQLLESGKDGLQRVRALAGVDDERVARHAREVLERMESSQADQEFTIVCHLFPKDGDLEQAVWLLARALVPGLDVGRCAVQMDAWGRELSGLLRGRNEPEEVVDIMSRFLAGDLGFRGNTEDYYHPWNSLLPCVINTRRGIPVTLTLLYMLVGKRCGVAIEGINMPGHFIAKHRSVYFDPFHSGMRLSLEDCEMILAKQQLAMQPGYLEPANARQMLHRILVNLAHIYNQGEDRVKRMQVAG